MCLLVTIENWYTEFTTLWLITIITNNNNNNNNKIYVQSLSDFNTLKKNVYIIFHTVYHWVSLSLD